MRGRTLGALFALALLSFAVVAIDGATNIAKGASAGWTGSWKTDYGTMVLTQSGTQVQGTYAYRKGRVDGTAAGHVLTGTWAEEPTYKPPNDAGTFTLRLNEYETSFTGTWRDGAGRTGTWKGERIVEATLAPGSYGTISATAEGREAAIGITVAEQGQSQRAITWLAVRGYVRCASYSPKTRLWKAFHIAGDYDELYPSNNHDGTYTSITLLDAQPIGSNWRLAKRFSFWSVTHPGYETSEHVMTPRLDVVDLDVRFTESRHAIGTIEYAVYYGPGNQAWVKYGVAPNLADPPVPLNRCVTPKWSFDAALGAPYHH